MEYLDPVIVQLALAAAILVQGAVNLVKMGKKDLPEWVPPSLAATFGPAFAALLMLAAGTAWSQQSGAVCLLAGLLAAMLAVGSTDLAKRAQAPRE